MSGIGEIFSAAETCQAKAIEKATVRIKIKSMQPLIIFIFLSPSYCVFGSFCTIKTIKFVKGLLKNKLVFWRSDFG